MRRTPRPVALAALLAAVLAAGTPLCAQVVVGAPASGIQVAPGGQVTVPVVVDMTGSGGFSLGSLTAQLSWKPTTLRFVGATGGTFGTPTLNPDSATGTLRFAVANPAGATGQVVVLQATFDATGPSGDTTFLNVAVSQLTSTVTFTDLTPVTTASLLCVGTASGTWGDVDNSGSVTSFDALLVVTYAVGLSIAPNSPALGDVDGNGQVTTRDALAILTHVVGLPTPGFIPGQPVAGACSGPPPATVTAAPTSVTLVVGDTIPLTATALDSLGQIVSTPGQAWTTLDPLVATVGPSGRVAAVGAGVTGAVVAVAPGVMDTVAVTVATTRTIWYVDVAAAAQNQTETGSPAYPFSTLQQAVDRAAPNDTVFVRGGSYGTGARSAKPLAVLGHPSYPVPRFGGAIVFDSIGAATVRLGRLVVADAPAGVQVFGLGGGVLVLDSVGIERAQGHGIELANFDSVSLRDVAIQGAVDKGLYTSDVRAHALAHVTVDGVSVASGGTGRAVWVLRSQAFVADTASFQLGSVRLDTVTNVRLHYVSIGQTTDVPFELTGALTADFDTVSVRFAQGSSTTAFAVTLAMQPGGIVTGRETEIRDIQLNGLHVGGAADVQWQGLNIMTGGQGQTAVAAAFPDVKRVTIRRSAITGGMVAQYDSAGTGNASFLGMDTVTLDYAPLLATGLDTVVIRGAIAHGGGPGSGSLIQVDGTPLVVLVGVEARASINAGPAISVTSADSLRADSLYVHDNPGQGLYVNSARIASIVGSRFERNSSGYYNYGTVKLFYVDTARVAQSVFEEGVQTTSLEWSGGNHAAQTLTVDTSTFRGSGVGVYTSALTANPARVTLRGAGLERGPAGYGRQLLYAYMPGWVRVLDATVDSTDYGSYAIYANTDTLDVANAQMHFVGSGVYGYPYNGTALLTSVTGSTIQCRTGQGGSYAGIQLLNAQMVVTGNTVSRCWTGIQLDGNYYATAAVSANTITALDSLNGTAGIQFSGNWRQAVISANTVSGGRMAYGGIYVAAGTSIDTLRVDSNTVQDGFGRGIYTYGQTRGTRFYRNTIQRMHPTGPSDAAFFSEYGYGTDTLVLLGNRLLQNRSVGVLLATGSGGMPIRLDSNVVVDDSLTALYVSNGSKVVGTANFLARNQNGIWSDGPITMDQSVIQQNTLVGAEAAPGAALTLFDNYWGDPTGPRCGVNCPGALGDSIAGSVSYSPFLTAAPSTPVGTPPVLRAAAGLRVPTAPARPRAVDAAWFEQLRRTMPGTRTGGGAR